VVAEEVQTLLQIKTVLLVVLVEAHREVVQVALETHLPHPHLREIQVGMEAQPGLTLAVVVAVALPLLVATALEPLVGLVAQELHPQLQAQA
jgi:hypothetical protein